MKHALIFVVGLLIGLGLYWGIASLVSEDSPEPVVTETTETTEPTEPVTEPNLIEEGKPWDEEGLLTELILQIPGAWGYSDCLPFGEDLLFYGYDSHMGTTSGVDLLLMDPVTGEIKGTASFDLREYVTPQVFGEYIYLCDCRDGKVIKLDATLTTVKQWDAPTVGWYWFIGAGETLYMFGDDKLERYLLEDGKTETVFEQCSMETMTNISNYVSITLKATVETEYVEGLLDLNTGEILTPPVKVPLSHSAMVKDMWLCRLDNSDNVYYLGNEEDRKRIYLGENSLQILQDGNLLLSTMTPQTLELYTEEGQFLSSCLISEHGNYYLLADPIWNEKAGGYFVLVKSYSGTLNVLFWDLNKPVEGENLKLEQIKEPSEMMKALELRAEQLHAKYGIPIFFGEETPTEFADFTGTATTNYDEISIELDHLEYALSQYPEGFLLQMRTGHEKGIMIYFLEDLLAYQNGEIKDTYAAFVTDQFDRISMVVDILSADEYTYYHEFSHIIDKYLERDAEKRPDALYSEAAWASLNPDYFTYADTYEGYEDIGYDTYWFIDAYATTKPTEDRARVLEFAMTPYMEHRFEEGTGLYRKLEYYAACIRDAFDTTGWPEVTLWEQYLN